MFGEQEVLIPSMLLCSLCDSLNSSRFVVVRTSNMAASIHWPSLYSRVSKNRSGYPLVFEDFGFLIYVAHFREMPKLWFDIICLFISL